MFFFIRTPCIIMQCLHAVIYNSLEPWWTQLTCRWCFIKFKKLQEKCVVVFFQFATKIYVLNQLCYISLVLLGEGKYNFYVIPKLICTYAMRSREISWNSHMWHFQFSILIEVLIWRGTSCWKLHVNRSSGSKVMSNWRILRTIENNRSSLLFLAMSHDRCCRFPTEPARSQHIICVIFSASRLMKLFKNYL